MSGFFACLQRTDASGTTHWWTYEEAERVLCADRLQDVVPVLEEAEAAASRGWHAIGWVAYEAAGAFDPHLLTHAASPPLARFTLYKKARKGLVQRIPSAFRIRDLTPTWDAEDFARRVETVRAAIARGETYQVNLTYPLVGRLEGDAWSLFRALRLGQAARHQAFLAEEDRWIVSVSPELFFRLDQGRILCRPMKGTAPPGQAVDLVTSTKNRAENLMIVDMIRNDLGKIARPGSVKVSRLFETEPYPTLVQMTSTIEAEGTERATEWFRALFPCASITGAPKRKTMEWIRDLESGPRGVYCGAIGGFHPEGFAEFCVPIRTAEIRRSDGHLRYSTGCGIVWDSDPASEHAESLLKARVLTHPAPEFELIETLLWTPERGTPLWARHRHRLLQSAHALGFAVDPDRVDHGLQAITEGLNAPTRIRLTMDVDGRLQWSVSPAPACDRLRAVVDNQPTPRDHPELAHKTTRRSVYLAAKERHPEVDEVILVNEAGELMEFCIGSLVLRLEGIDVTPPLRCGLLPGVARAAELAAGTLQEAVLRPSDLARAEAVWLLNAVRGRVAVDVLNIPNQPFTTRAGEASRPARRGAPH